MQAYISVIKDESSFTITLPQSIQDSFLLQARAAKIQASQIHLRGSYHTPDNRRIYTVLKALSNAQGKFCLPTSRDITGSMATLVPWPKPKNAFSETDILDAILIKRCDWASSIATTVSSLQSDKAHTVLVVGLHQCISTALIKDYRLQVVAAAKYIGGQSMTSKGTPPVRPNEKTSCQQPYGDDAIAIIGMGCRFPGCDSVEQFWDIVNTGTSTLSQLPATRFSVNEDNVSWKYEGNFLQQPEVFDHRFFNLSAREAASMDPQQRLALQVAYEALQSSGHFKEAAAHSKQVGCYIGVASVDYQDNVDSNTPGAFSLVGTVRAFIAGRISHYFGWTGPSLTFDTACSSSLVAIHNACKDIRSGECDTALAGGVNVITSPFLFNALGAANFTSRTGPSKPFDNDADGYCRGEGCGLVVLKRLSHALEANDHVLAVISSSAVNQNENSTPITVPHSGSQIKLYQQVAAHAGVVPTEVTYLEAHGTGTSKGDPIEMESIRNVFGDKLRKSPLVVGSVKGNIGHLEAASGAAALIKTVLMMQKNTIPPLANFKRLNRNIIPLQGHGIEIATESRPWNTDWKAACINNYGAAGSNACVLVCQPPFPRRSRKSIKSPCGNNQQARELFHVSARTKESLRAYCKALETHIMRSSNTPALDFLSSLAFSLAYRHNPAHAYSVTMSTSSLTELRSKLYDTATAKDHSISGHPTKRTPVVLCFGGQTKDYIGFSKQVYDDSTLLQGHLRHCEAVCTTIGQGHIFPHIFDQNPIDDLVDLHCSLFAMQYSCAKAWIDSGLVVDALVGHSFGQLTALCISGVLSLEDTLSYICKRAKLIQGSWGPEKGAMLSVDAEKATLDQVLAAISAKDLDVQVACYNSPTLSVLSGSLESIAAIEKFIYDMIGAGQSIRCRKLDVTHGYHSQLVSAITPELANIAKNFDFATPNIPIEICSEQRFLNAMAAEELASHSQRPVFFTDAILRLANRLESACWIEAGSNSGIISLVKRNLAAGHDLSRHVCIPTHLESPANLSIISDSVATLLQSGIHVRHWAHHPLQNQQYEYLNLPAYQFEKPRHWLEYRDRSTPSSSEIPVTKQSHTELVHLIAHSDEKQTRTVFGINTTSEEFIVCTNGHSVLGNALCPASLYIEMATRAAKALMMQAEQDSLVSHIEDLQMSAPLGLMSASPVELHTTRDPTRNTSWTFQIISDASAPADKQIMNAKGTISLRDTTSANIISEKRRYQRLVSTDRCHQLLSNADAESMQGRLIYDHFAPLVDYQPCYRGIKRISSMDGQVAGLVRLESSNTARAAISHILALDNFTQVAGFYANVMHRKEKEYLLLCTAVADIRFYGELGRKASSAEWLVYCTVEAVGKNGMESDIYIFEPGTNALVATLLGVQFTRVRSASLLRILEAGPAGQHGLNHPEKRHLGGKTVEKPLHSARLEPTNPKKPTHIPSQSITDTRSPDYSKVVQDIIADIMQVPRAEILPSSFLVELGIDSLVGIELLTEISKKLGVQVSVPDFSGLDTVQDLSSMIESMVAAKGTTSRAEHNAPRDILQYHTIPAPLVNISRTETGTEMSQGDSGRARQVLSAILSELLDLSSDTISQDFHLEEAGLDSLLSIEMLAEVNRELQAKISSSELVSVTTFGDLVKLTQQHLPQGQSRGGLPTPPHIPNGGAPEMPSIIQPGRVFADMRSSFSHSASQTHFADFFETVYPSQRRLVLSYVLEAFSHLGCSLADILAHAEVPRPSVDGKHTRLLPRLMKILEDAELVYASPSGSGFLRSVEPVPTIPSSSLYEEIMYAFPQYAHEHRLLHATGSMLGACLSGERDPLQIIFGENKQLSADVYAQSPLFATPTHVLASFLTKLFEESKNKRKGYGGSDDTSNPIRILEIGAGTGGTTTTILNVLTSLDVHFEYTFTDISPSFIHEAKRRFAPYGSRIKYLTLDIEHPPPLILDSHFDVVISSNCIHATRDLREASKHIRTMLRPEGILCLVELMRPLEWLDLVFGLLDGWWRFSDNREYALVSEWHWEAVLRDAGFAHVDWSGGGEEELESAQIRVVLGCKGEQEGVEVMGAILKKVGDGREKGKGKGWVKETVRYACQGGIELFADIYYPKIEKDRKGGTSTTRVEKRPVGEYPSITVEHICRPSKVCVADQCSVSSSPDPRRRPHNALPYLDPTLSTQPPPRPRLPPCEHRLPSLPRSGPRTWCHVRRADRT
jgi:acyl transferase domain-containing protein/SAM-dependent methyltransferase